jgi:hypothetical protein
MPAQPGTVLMRPVKGKEVLNSEDQTTLRSGMGKRMYQMQYSRPDIAPAVCDLARYITCRNSKMLEAMKRCMRFVLCSRNAGLLLKLSRKWDGSNKHQFRIRGRSDSDYAKDTQTRQSVSGYVVYLEDAPTMHRSDTQKTVALLSCKAELNAAVLCAQDMMYHKNMLESIGLKVELPIILEMDNKGAVDLVNSFSVGGCMQHIDVKQCFLQELKEAKVLDVKWTPGSENEADIFTKILDGPLFKHYAELLLCEGEISGKGGDTKYGGCLKAYLQYLVFGIFKSRFTFDANPFSFLT